MTVFAVPIDNNDMIDAEILRDFIAQGKKKNIKAKEEMDNRMKKISRFIEIKES